MKLAASGEKTLSKELDIWQIREFLYQVVKEMVDAPEILVGNDGWWEAYSHGLSQPVHDKIIDKVQTVESYLEKESDFLNLDSDGFDRGSERLLDQERSVSENGLRSLALRVIAFTRLRQKLEGIGMVLPPNSDLEKALHLVRSELAKDVSINAFEQSMCANKSAMLITEAPAERLTKD